MTAPAPTPQQVSITPFIEETAIHARVEEMARAIALAMPQDFLVIALLRGSFIFAADLLRALHRAGARPQVDFLTISSYGDAMQSSGQLNIHRELSCEVKDRPILLVDDILESGRTLSFAMSEMARRGAASASIAVLLEKPGKRAEGVHLEADFTGFTIEDRFVVGYGLDYANYYRELPYIGVVEP